MEHRAPGEAIIIINIISTCYVTSKLLKELTIY
jgi:hypothetical protein